MSEQKKSISDNILDSFTDEEKADMLQIQQEESQITRYAVKKARFEAMRKLAESRKAVDKKESDE